MAVAIDPRRAAAESVVETIVTQRGRIVLECWPWGTVDWVASDQHGQLVAMGEAQSRAYAIAGAYVALVRGRGSEE